MCGRGEQKRHRHRIKYGYKRQSKQPDRPLKVGGRRTDQLGEISHGADVSLGAPALGANLGFLDLQAGKCPGLALGVLPRYRRDCRVSGQRSSSP